MLRISEDELSYPGQDGRYHHGGVPFTGMAFSLFPDGGLQSEGEYRDGVPWGLQRVFRSDGGIQIEGTRAAGHKEGYWRTWHPNGRLATKEWYHVGLALTRKKWDREGNLIENFTRPETDARYQNMLRFRRVWGHADRPIPRPPDSAETGEVPDQAESESGRRQGFPYCGE